MIKKESKKEPYSGKSDSDFYVDIQNQYNHYLSGVYDELKNKGYYKDVKGKKIVAPSGASSYL